MRAGVPRAARRRAAIAAAALAFASAAVTAFWLLGGTAGLDTVGGEIERLARERSTPMVLVLGLTLLLKLAAGMLAVALMRRSVARGVVRLALVTGIVLSLYGGVLVAVGAVVLAGVGDPPSDSYALRTHVFLWDLWFFVWGLSLTRAALQPRRHES
jgi:hypothetical protein